MTNLLPSSDTAFSANEWLRYTRHIQLPQVGAEGQQKLKNACVLIVGAGGLGSPVALYLAAAGVGHITLIDDDQVDITNLQRQILFDTTQLGDSKVESARQKLQALNPEISVSVMAEKLSQENAKPLIIGADLIVDCTDNFTARYLINDLCAQYQKPWLFAAIYQFEGQCALFSPGNGCFRCLFPEPPAVVADCNTAGVLGVLPGILGTLQANEALKFLLGLPTPLKDCLLLVDAINLSFRKINRVRDQQCPLCGDHKVAVDQLVSFQPACVVERDTVVEIDTVQFNRLRNRQSCLLIDVRSDAERAGFHIGGEHIPLQNLPLVLQRLDRTKEVICYCQSGKRSAEAASLLTVEGFDAKSLKGGLVSWLKQSSYAKPIID